MMTKVLFLDDFSSRGKYKFTKYCIGKRFQRATYFGTQATLKPVFLLK